MSRLRLAHPGTMTRFLDLGPSAPGKVGGSQYLVPAVGIAEMRPVLSSGAASRQTGYRLPAMHVVPEKTRPICGTPLPGWRNQHSKGEANEVCARTPGHRDSHRSRWVMDDEARRRRGEGYVA